MFFTRLIEKAFKHQLYKKKNLMVRKAMDIYIKKNPGTPPQTLEILEKMLLSDVTSIYTYTDGSVLRARILQANYTFLITISIGLGLSILLAIFTGGITLPLILSPILAALVAWAAALATIPVSYNSTIEGVMDAALIDFEREITKHAEIDNKIKYHIEAALSKSENNAERQSSPTPIQIQLSAQDIATLADKGNLPIVRNINNFFTEPLNININMPDESNTSLMQNS